MPLRTGSEVVPLRLVRHPRARRYVLRVTPSADVIVTLPRWGSLKEARAFAEQHIEWITRERVRRTAEAAETADAWADGTGEMWLRGERVPVRIEDGVVTAGDISARIGGGSAEGRESRESRESREARESKVARAGEHRAEGGAGGNRMADARRALRAALRAAAKRELPPRLLELAAREGLHVTRVTVRDQRSRWGSCSSRGAIALNWRLLLMPPDVRDYVLWHELMHLRRADHSPGFWKLVAAVCPEYQDARAWLRKYGRALET